MRTCIMKSAYIAANVLGIGYWWDPLLSMSPIRGSAHYRPPCLLYRPPSSGCSVAMHQLMQFLKTLAYPTLMENSFYIDPFKYPKYTYTHRYFADAAPISWNLSQTGRESRCQLYWKWNFLANLDLKYTKVSNCTLREGNLKYQRTFWPSH